LAVKKFLPHYDWVLWMDCDSLFMNASIRIEALVESALAASEDPDNVHVIVSSDGAMLNTGVVLFRRHPWTMGFLEEVYSAAGGLFVTFPWWEQAAMHFLLNDAPGASERRAHVQLVPQWWMNRCVPLRKVMCANVCVCACVRVRECISFSLPAGCNDAHCLALHQGSPLLSRPLRVCAAVAPPPLPAHLPGSYPVQLAVKLRTLFVGGGERWDGGPGDPLHLLHEPFNTGHFIVSFSGCVVLLESRSMCNDLFVAFARLGAAAVSQVEQGR
jgi:hypothetical protein